MDSIKDLLQILECPACHEGGMELDGAQLRCCLCGKRYRIIDGVPDLAVTPEAAVQERIDDNSFEKWDRYYDRGKDAAEDAIGFGPLCSEHVQIFKELGLLQRAPSGDIVLDVGCGRGYVAYGLSKLGRKVIGIDFVLEALLFAKKKFEEEGLSGLFVRADMSNLPFKKDAFGFVYSLGVLEHLPTMEAPVKEIHRVLKRGGHTFNVVPAVSVSSLTYAQLWGSIPNIPVVRGIFYFLHHKLLKGRHCVYGFELNYLGSQLRKIFDRAGFVVNDSKVFAVTCPLYKVKNKFLKSFGKMIITSRLFTRHIYIYSEKEGDA